MADWVGWVFLAGRWWRASKAATMGECCRLLTRAAQEEKVPDTDCCLTRGSAPVGPPPSRQKAVPGKEQP